MSNMVTRCPKCATSFRITSAQLQSAKGAVRCGSCLHIFKASDHLVSPADHLASKGGEPAAIKAAAPAAAAVAAEVAKERAAPPSATAPIANTPSAETPAARSTPSDTLVFDQAQIDDELAALDDDILISDDMHQTPRSIEDEHFDDSVVDHSKSTMSLFERDLSPRKEIEEKDEADESWAESLLDEADDEARFEAVRHRISASEHDAGYATDDRESSAEKDDLSASQATGYSGHMFSLIDDEPPSDLREIHTQEELSRELDEEFPAHNPEPDSAFVQAAEQPPLRAYDTSRAALLMNIMPEPVVMTGRNKRRARQKRLWLSLSVVMLAVLLIQVAWMQFDRLSRISPYRSVYGWLCPYLGCELPTLVDRSKIRVRNLLVRKHPDLADALILDVIVLNTAPFPQPFPDLVMEFSDINETTLAARRFTPGEYLRGELAGYQLMPQNQPVHISLELADPGEAAVNYKIEPY